MIDAILVWFSQYVASHSPYARSRMGRVAQRWYARTQPKVSSFGAAAVLSTTFLSIFVVVKKSKATAHIYLGKSWIVRGKSVGKTMRFAAPFPLFDHAASLHARYAR